MRKKGIRTMRVSKAVGYAVRALAYLANKGKGRRVTLSEIAKAEDIPEAYLVKVMKRLAAECLVTIFRGSVGGYTLTRKAGDVTMLEVFEAIEGKLILRDCTESPLTCNRSKKCPARPVWIDLQSKVTDAFARCTLAELSGAR
jgi:Rrf2 family protein